MEIHGKILSVLEEKTGISPKTGKNWRCGKNGVCCYSKNGHAVTDLTRQS